MARPHSDNPNENRQVSPALRMERLLSARQDGPLTPEEEAELGRLMREIPDADKIAADYARMSRLLGTWRTPSSTVDWSTHASSISREVAAAGESESDTRDAALNELLSRWAAVKLPVAWDSLKNSISEAVHLEAMVTSGTPIEESAIAKRRPQAARASTKRRWLLWTALPLSAAAAAVLLAVWIDTGRQGLIGGSSEAIPVMVASAPKSMPEPAIQISLTMPVSGGALQVTLDEGADLVGHQQEAEEGIAYAIGPARRSMGGTDEAWWY